MNPEIISFVKWLLPTLSLLTAIGIGIFFLHALFYRRGFLYDAYRENKSRLLWMAFAVALTATLGSLFYSEIAGYAPCKLCWFERIFMYPLSIILGIAAVRKDKSIGIYVLPLAIIGALITMIHYPEQIFSTLSYLPCAAQGGVDCGIKYTFSYGFITIPMMAMIAFIAISILVFLKLRER